MFLVILLTLAGFTLSGYLSELFYTTRTGTASFDPICHLGAFFDCQTVLASPQAEWLGLFPLSSLAAGWFLSLLILESTLLLIPSAFPLGRILLWGYSVLGTLVGLPYLVIMAFQLHTFCLFCLMIDGIHMALVWKLFPGWPTLKQSWGLKAVWVTLIKHVLGVLIPVLVLIFFSFRHLFQAPMIPETEKKRIAENILASPAASFSLPKELPSLGPWEAPITIIEQSDYECPHCQRAAKVMKQILKRYPTQVRLIFRNYPVSNHCNPFIEHKGHPFACEAAKLSICAQEWGEFEKTYELLFEHQASFAQKSPLSWVLETSKIPQSQWQACLEAPQTRFFLEQDIQFGVEQRIPGTPQFWINGHPTGPLPFDIWCELIEKILEKLLSNK